MFSRGNYVVIKKRELYNGEIGKIKSYDGIMYYKVSLCSIKKTINCLDNEIELATDSDIRKHIVLLNVDNNIRLKLKDQNIKTSYDCLNENQVFKGLYCLGKYFPLGSFPILHKEDYLSQTIIKLKNPNNAVSDKIYTMFINFISLFNNIKKVIKKIDYIAMMPSLYYYNHIEPWGRKICNRLKKKDISSFISIAHNKKHDLQGYKSKNQWQRSKSIEGAFILDSDNVKFPILQNKACLLLDDVCTTGYHINELTNTLSREGIMEVYAFVIGKTKPDFILI